LGQRGNVIGSSALRPPIGVKAIFLAVSSSSQGSETRQTGPRRPGVPRGCGRCYCHHPPSPSSAMPCSRQAAPPAGLTGPGPPYSSTSAESSSTATANPPAPPPALLPQGRPKAPPQPRRNPTTSDPRHPDPDRPLPDGRPAAQTHNPPRQPSVATGLCGTGRSESRDLFRLRRRGRHLLPMG
jgi:hypothetical protein